jgi:exodeoxyribonuclease VII small subunit
MAKKTQSPPKSFEDALEELEQLLADIEDGQVALEQCLTKYERGTFLIQHCRTVLSSAEKQIDLLTRGGDGEIAVQPMNEATTPT